MNLWSSGPICVRLRYLDACCVAPSSDIAIAALICASSSSPPPLDCPACDADPPVAPLATAAEAALPAPALPEEPAASLIRLGGRDCQTVGIFSYILSYSTRHIVNSKANDQGVYDNYVHTVLAFLTTLNKKKRAPDSKLTCVTVTYRRTWSAWLSGIEPFTM